MKCQNAEFIISVRVNKFNCVKACRNLDYCDALFLLLALTVRLEKEEAVFYIRKVENFEVRVQIFGCSQTMMIDNFMASNYFII